MKRVFQIAKECGVSWHTVDSVVVKEKFTKQGLFLNKHQEDLIHQILYFEGKITEITLESKMNYE